MYSTPRGSFASSDAARDDIQGTDIGGADFQILLRAERAGGGSGRTYTVTYRATDESGNAASAGSAVFVPHDRGGITEPMMITAHENSAGTLLEWNDVPGAQFYNVVRGKLGNLQDKNNSFHFGQVRCIASGLVTPATAGMEEPELPPLGEGFFYLVEYDDGRASSYGTMSAAKERFIPGEPSDCN